MRQDIQDLKHHFARREALYRHLGFLPSTFKGKNIVEFGPDSEDDAVQYWLTITLQLVKDSYKEQIPF